MNTMNRRAFMAALAASPLAASKPAVEAIASTPAVLPSRRPVSHVLTPKQQETWNALRQCPGVRAVLFSGSRGCGKTHLARVWADNISATGGEYLVIVPTVQDVILWRDGITQRGEYVVQASRSRGVGRFRNVIIDKAHAMAPDELRHACTLIHEEGRVLFTSLVSGTGVSEMRRFFPFVGWNTYERYHVNASMWDNPHLATPEYIARIKRGIGATALTGGWE